MKNKSIIIGISMAIIWSIIFANALKSMVGIGVGMCLGISFGLSISLIFIKKDKNNNTNYNKSNK